MTEVVYDLIKSQPGVRVLYQQDFQPRVDSNCARVKNRFTANAQPRSPLAIVGFGPTLRETWLELHPFKDIWTVSGAHDFLLSKKIVPTYHTDIEWRDHKVKFIKKLHPDVRYILGSTIHPTYLDRFQDEYVELFHVQQHPDNAILPEGEFTVPADWDVLITTVHLAAAQGYTEIHFFGVDYCGDKESKQMGATEHLGIPKELVYFGVNGQTFLSSKDMFEGCKLLPMIMGKYPHITYYIHGDGMLKHYLIAKTQGLIDADL